MSIQYSNISIFWHRVMLLVSNTGPAYIFQLRVTFWALISPVVGLFCGIVEESCPNGRIPPPLLFPGRMVLLLLTSSAAAPLPLPNPNGAEEKFSYRSRLFFF